MAAEDSVPQYKLLVIGDSSVGKSWLLLRWTSDGNSFDKKVKNAPPTATIGLDFKNKKVEINGQQVKIQVWDTAGQERFRNITASYYTKSHGVLLVYDISSRQSFENVRNWIAQVNKSAPASTCKILIGNKCDLQRSREVSFEEGEALANEFNIPFFETSAMNDINVDHAFMTVATNVKVRQDSAKPARKEGVSSPNGKGGDGESSASVSLTAGGGT